MRYPLSPASLSPLPRRDDATGKLFFTVRAGTGFDLHLILDVPINIWQHFIVFRPVDAAGFLITALKGQGAKIWNVATGKIEKIGILSIGEAEVYVRIPNPGTRDYKEKIWDHAAGHRPIARIKHLPAYRLFPDISARTRGPKSPAWFRAVLNKEEEFA